MTKESQDGTPPGSTQQVEVFAASFDLHTDPSVGLLPEEILISKFSETEGRVSYRLVCTLTGRDTSGLPALLQAIWRLSEQETGPSQESQKKEPSPPTERTGVVQFPVPPKRVDGTSHSPDSQDIS